MRDLSELNINEGGKPIMRLAPTRAVVDAFQAHFGITLPKGFCEFLQFSNGGHPELDSIHPIGRPEGARWSVSRFYHLDDDKTSPASLWGATEKWRNILGPSALPFARDGGGNQFFLDCKRSSPSVQLCIHDENFLTIDIASSFEAFIDALEIDPDTI